jgi:hypothetical protein
MLGFDSGETIVIETDLQAAPREFYRGRVT